MHSTVHYELIGFRAMDLHLPYEFIALGTMYYNFPGVFIGLGAADVICPMNS